MAADIKWLKSTLLIAGVASVMGRAGSHRCFSAHNCSCCVLQDKSWRVRYNVAAQMVPLCEALGPEMTRAELVPAYTKLLEDTEAEVRIAAAGKVSAFSRMLTPQLIVTQVGYSGQYQGVDAGAPALCPLFDAVSVFHQECFVPISADASMALHLA
jgi:hypothetical protein